MRKMGRMRLPWNVYENTRLSLMYPGMLLINIEVSLISRQETGWMRDLIGGFTARAKTLTLRPLPTL
jgi:hypothetical protein